MEISSSTSDATRWSSAFGHLFWWVYYFPLSHVIFSSLRDLQIACSNSAIGISVWTAELLKVSILGNIYWNHVGPRQHSWPKMVGALAEILLFSARCSNSTTGTLPTSKCGMGKPIALALGAYSCFPAMPWPHTHLLCASGEMQAEGSIDFLLCAPWFLRCWTRCLSCKQHRLAPWLVGGCLEVEWKLFVEYVMRTLHVCRSLGDWLSSASHNDATSFLSLFGFLKHRRTLPFPHPTEKSGFILPPPPSPSNWGDWFKSQYFRNDNWLWVSSSSYLIFWAWKSKDSKLNCKH